MKKFLLYKDFKMVGEYDSLMFFTTCYQLVVYAGVY